MTNLGFGESPRWHQNRLWFANRGTRQIVSVDLAGKSEVMVRVPTTLPHCFDWRPDGRLLIVSGPEGLVLRMQPDRSLVTHADLKRISAASWNEIVVDGRGNAYVNGGGMALVSSDGSVRQVAEGFAFPNGMAVTFDSSTLIVAESHAKRLTAFDIAAGGSLRNRRMWANLGDGVPDGICIDAGNAVWYGDGSQPAMRAGPRRRRSARDPQPRPRVLRLHAWRRGPETLFMVAAE